MKKLILAVTVSILALGSATAQQTCERRAIGKDGKPLVGAARTSFLKKCKTDVCAAKAVDKNGKPLAGAAKVSFMKKCEQGA